MRLSAPTSLSALAILAVAACSSSSNSTGTGHPDAGADGSTPVDGSLPVDGSAPEDAGDSSVADGGGNCAAYAAAECDFLNACEPGVLATNYGTVANCEASYAALCTADLAATGSGVTPTFLGACSQALQTAVAGCASGPVPRGVPTVGVCTIAGAGAAGSPCGVNAQCASNSCSHEGASCGQCTQIGSAGAQCGTGSNVTCAVGLVCGTQHTCVPYVALNAACDGGASIGECELGADCVYGDAGATTGTCLKSGVAAGTTCSATHVGAADCWADAGFFCDPATNQCAAISYGAPAAACGTGDGGTSDNACSDGVCVAGACVARGTLGSSCTVGGGGGCDPSTVCVAPAMDSAGTCTALDTLCAASDAGTLDFSFSPSNVPVSVILAQASQAQPENVAAACTITTDASSPGTNDCFTSPTEVVTQANGSTVNLIVVRSLTVQTTGSIVVDGDVPLVIVSLSDIDFLGGNLQANSTNGVSRVGPGGGAGGSGAGAGAGGGAASSTTTVVGGGGGSYCGIGGAGGGGTKSTGYGNDENRPLLGGSAGGAGATGGTGAGGGALQLVATGSITIPAGAYITVSGAGGGQAGDGCTFQNGGGAGSGGALLIEAPSVTIGGILAANGGGGGGGNANGMDGWDNLGGGPSTPATGSPATSGGAAGGAGGAGTTIGATNGAAGTTCATTGIGAGGGGGGAGWIRINTAPGAATITGTISPDVSTRCTQQGVLRGENAGP